MRRIAVLISALLLTASTMEQYGSGSDSKSQPDKDLIIVEGCLGGSSDTYSLTDPAGASYRLAGKTEKLKDLLGQTIRVTAVSKPVVSVPGSMSEDAMSEGTETRPALSVITVTRLSGHCTSGGNNIP